MFYLNMAIDRDVSGGRQAGEADEIPTTGDCGKNDFCGTLQPETKSRKRLSGFWQSFRRCAPNAEKTLFTII